MVTDFSPKNSQKFYCEKCDFTCSKKSDWSKHILRAKHLLVTDVTKLVTQKTPYECNICSKIYYSRNGLWSHKKKCNLTTKLEVTENSLTNDKELILTLLNQNNQLQNQIIELCKEKSHTTIHTTNNIHKTFNLNVFLNETCKDAMNIMDFVDSLKLQLSDLENVGKLGFVEGISNIIVKNLRALEIHKRPVHCSDSKREIMYIKDENKWEKDNEENNKLRKAIKRVANKNSKLIPEFREKYPDCNQSISKYSDQYNKLIIEALGGRGDNNIEKENKIIRKIAKEVVINKE